MDRTLKSKPKSESLDATAAQPFPNEAIRTELQRILISRLFRKAEGQKRFVAYVVEEVLAGRAQLLKEYVIATEALGRDVSFDPRLDPIVRTEARKLRAKLVKYYEGEGVNDPLRIELPKGSYVPIFHVATPAAPEAATEVPSEQTDVDIESASPAASDVPSAEPAPVRPRPDWRRATVLVFSLSVIAIAAIFYGLTHPRLPQTTLDANDASIAVLPLVNLGDSSDEFLSDGLTDELINALHQAPGLRVVSRTSAFRFKAKSLDLRAIDQKLHVRAVLIGTVKKSDNRLRFDVQLNNAENGYYLWSGSYERDTAEMGTIPPEIASAVSNVLGAGLIRNGGHNSSQFAVTNVEAHEDYLRGLYFRNQYNVDSLNKAIAYFRRAISEDPSFGQAYAGLADCYAMARPVFATPPLQVISKIRAAASKALELNPKLGEPHIDLAVSSEYEFDWATAEREFKKGLELSPGNVIGHIWYAWYLTLLGRKDEVLTQKKLAVRLDPVSPYAVESVGGYYSDFGRSETALEQYRSALALEPNFGLAHQDLGDTYLFRGQCDDAIRELRLANEAMPGPRRMARLGFAYGVCGHPAEARKILRDFLAEPRHGAIPALAVAEIYLGLGDKDRAVPWIERAIDERDLDLNLKSDAHFESLRADPRFIELLHRMKLT